MRYRRILKIAGMAFIFAVLFAASLSQRTSSTEVAAEDNQIPISPTPPETFIQDAEAHELPVEIYEPDILEVEALARMLYGEARGVESTMEQAACVWCVLNRVDNPRFPDSMLEVLEVPKQFVGYKKTHPILPELAELAADVLTRHHAEQAGEGEVGRVLPPEYVFFTGDGKRNHFQSEWKGADFYDWSLVNPYED